MTPRLTLTPYTVYVWVVLAGTLLPFWGLLFLLPRGRVADRAVKRCARLLLWLAGCPVRVRGLERLAGHGPVVFVANHSSYLDSVVLLAALPFRYRFVVTHEAAAWPVIGLSIRKAGYLVVNNSNLADRHACARAMQDTLRLGTSLVVFPEGTIRRDGTLLPFRPGAFRIAVDAGCPVVPVTLRGTTHVAPGGLWLVRRGPLDVVIHGPITPADGGRREIARVRDDAHRAIAGSLAESSAP